MSRTLSEIISDNVRAAIRRAGDPSVYRLSREMVEVMARPPGPGREKHGLAPNPETCRRAVEMCLAGQKVWRVDYLEAIAAVLGVPVVDLVSPASWPILRKRVS